MQPFGRNRYGPKIGGLCPFGEGEVCPHLTQCGRAEAYLHAKFRLDPSNRLATVRQRYRQTEQTDRQRTDSIETVAQKGIFSARCVAGCVDGASNCTSLPATIRLWVM